MKKRKVSYRRINWFIFLLIATSMATGIFIALKLWFILIIILPLMALSISRLLSVYSGIIDRLGFIIRAVRNDDCMS